MTLNNKILQLPSDQLSWLLLSKNIFKRTFNSTLFDKKEFIDAVKTKANEKGYDEIVLIFKTYDFELYFKN
ncbi:MAG: hypothetical protein GQ552_04195 [Flavobacteriaceae bacterium]|nr:hypothetical protein [Flavobacteriaceae bacterium]